MVPLDWRSCLLATACLPGQSEMGWVTQTESPLPDRLLSSVTRSCLAALRASDLRLHGLSIWISQWSVCWSQFVFHCLPHGTELNITRQRHNTHRLKHTLTCSKKMERGDTEIHILSEQSTAACKKACVWTGGECKAGFTPSPKNAG